MKLYQEFHEVPLLYKLPVQGHAFQPSRPSCRNIEQQILKWNACDATLTHNIPDLLLKVINTKKPYIAFLEGIQSTRRDVCCWQFCSWSQKNTSNIQSNITLKVFFCYITVNKRSRHYSSPKGISRKLIHQHLQRNDLDAQGEPALSTVIERHDYWRVGSEWWYGTL